jgi:protein ImuA
MSAVLRRVEGVKVASACLAAPVQAAQQALMTQLAGQVQRIELAGRVSASAFGRTQRVFSTGCTSLDCCLPSGGYDSGTLVEYFQTHRASSAMILALTAAREAMVATAGYGVFIDWSQQFYPPAAAAMGLDLKRLIIVRPCNLADRLWAIDQALRSPAIAAVVAEVEHLDDRGARRLQLAAEQGGGIGLLVRHAAAQRHPSWAEVQWLVRPLAVGAAHRQLELQLLRARGGRMGARQRVQIHAVHGRIEQVLPSQPSASTQLAAASHALAGRLAHPSPRRNPSARECSA